MISKDLFFLRRKIARDAAWPDFPFGVGSSQGDALIASQDGHSIQGPTFQNVKPKIGFGPDDEKRPSQGESIQATKVGVPMVHFINGRTLYRKRIRRIYYLVEPSVITKNDCVDPRKTFIVWSLIADFIERRGPGKRLMHRSITVASRA